jgi:hypothetical protein
MIHLGLVWVFLIGNVYGNILLFFLIVGSILLLTLIFQAACSLANVEPPGFLYSLLLVLLTLVFTVPLNGFLAYLVVGSVMHQWVGGAVVATFLFFIGFILCVLISSVLYILLLRISILKGFLTGLFEQLLALLAFSLLYGILLVIMALIQIFFGPFLPENAVLTPPAARTVAVALAEPS